MKNEYYDIACNDLKFLQATLHLGFFNQFAIAAQQIAEKMLKSVAEIVCVGIDKLMRTHNLRAIYIEINKVESDFVLDKEKLSVLKNVYFGAQSPGDNFVYVDIELCTECLNMMYDVIDKVNEKRKQLGLPVEDFKRMVLPGSTT